MAEATIGRICNELADAIRAAGITDVTKRYVAFTDASDLAARRVVVVPRNTRFDNARRDALRTTHEIWIYVQQQVDANDTTTIENLVKTAETIAGLWDNDGSLRDAKLNGYSHDGQLEYDMDELYDIEDLTNSGQFSSVLIVRYQNYGN